MTFRLPFLVTAFLALASVALGQSVRWEMDPGSPSTVMLQFEDCAPEGQPDLPNIPGATLSYTGQSTNMSLVNGSFTRSVTLTYLVRMRQAGPLQIPAFTVKTNRGDLRVPAFNGNAGQALSIDSVASSRLTPDKTTVWAGEVFGLTYELSAARRNNPQVNQTFDWNAAPLVAEDWSKPEVSESVVNGERRLIVLYRTRAAAKSPNTLRLEAASHLLNIQTGTVGFGFLSQPRIEPVSVTSDQPVIEVRPLPPAPAGFDGAVGQFKLVSKVVPEKAAVGEPVTWTLELSGTGNWPDIAGLPSREVSNDFQVVQPKAKRTPAEGKLFDVALSEDVVLVPTKPGNYILGPVTFTYFDPKAGAYQTITTPRTTLAITPPGAPQFNVLPQPGASQPAPADASVAPAEERIRRTPTTPAAPAGLPRDPLPGQAEAAVPMATGTVLLFVGAPFAALLLFWLGLAVQRARRTDPGRPLREARDRMIRTLGTLTAADESDRHRLLLAWQRDAALLWQIPHAAPPARVLPDPGWVRLWDESDRALYGANSTLPTDWTARALEAAVNRKLPPFRLRRLFLPQNLMPFAALLLVGGLAVASAIAAAEKAALTDPHTAYRSGDFAGAEKAWRSRLASVPTDWIARHNLALALAQTDRPGESAAHAAAAFIQNPQDPSVRWHFALAAERAGFIPANLTPFLQEQPRAVLAAAGSPARWQWVVIAAAFLVAFGLGLLLRNAYGPGLRRTSWIAASLAGFGVLTGAAGAAGWTAYGLGAHADAVIAPRQGTLRSIPTEADASQKTTALPAGSIAIVDREFLGWRRLAFPNGQTGWVRKEDVVPVWR